MRQPLLRKQLLALRGRPPYKQRPELLYERIALALEEEVKGLQAELARRLGAEQT